MRAGDGCTVACIDAAGAAGAAATAGAAAEGAAERDVDPPSPCAGKLDGTRESSETPPRRGDHVWPCHKHRSLECRPVSHVLVQNRVWDVTRRIWVFGSN